MAWFPCQPAYDAKEQTADLGIVPLDGSAPPRQLTQTKSSESGAAWSPDATKIAFSAKREGDEVSQLYILNVGGGEAERVTSLTLGARQPKWSPDGKQLLFVSDAFPDCADEAANKKAATERKDRKYNVRSYETFPIRFWDRWLDDKQAHLFVQDAKAGAKARDLFAGTKLIASPGFGAPNTDEGQAIHAEWSPDGTSILFTALANRNESARAPVPAQIFEVALAGGEPRRLSSDQNSYAQLQFSPDGKSLLCTATEERVDQVYSLARLTSFPWPFDATKRTVLSGALDRAVNRYAIPTNGTRVWFTAEEAGLENLWSVAPTGGEVKGKR